MKRVKKSSSVKSSPSSLKQTKISAFCVKRDEQPIVPRKRRMSEDENCENRTPKKSAIRLGVDKGSPPKKALQNLNNLIGFDDFGDFDLEDPFLNLEVSELDFERPLKCVVLNSQMSKFERILTVKDVETEKTGTCKLRDVWAFVVIQLNATVTVKAVKTPDGWVVDGKNGYLSFYPEIILSATALIGAMFCKRRGVLSHFYKGMDTANKMMIVGRLVHEALQNSLKNRSSSTEDIQKIVDDLLSTTEYLRELYSSDMTLEEAKLDVSLYVPRIKHFLDVYVSKAVPLGESGFKTEITEFRDIEENLTSTNLGVTGRVDVMVKVHDRTMPLELKTGRASMSNEHKAQVVYYTMMLTELGEEARSGLLLYLKDEVMEEVTPSQVETRDLILHRNEFVQYLKTFKSSPLPDPVRFPKVCAKCPYLSICSAYLEKEELSQSHPIRTIELPTLKRSHIDYFMTWTKLVLMEGEENENDDERSVLTDLKLQPGVVPFKNRFKHEFLRAERSDIGKLEPGSFITVSCGSRTNLSSGKIVNLTRTHCSVLLGKELTNLTETYRVDLFKSSGISVRYLTNLGCLLENGQMRLRDIVIDKKTPTFSEYLEKSKLNGDCIKILKPLNKDQQRAVLKVLTTNDYILIKGPPGTGKTQTIVSLVRILIKLDYSVLITSHTHSSVDNILHRLGDVDYLRLGSLKSVNKKIHSRCYETLVEKCGTVEEIKALFDKKVIASTCLGLDADVVQKKQFDVCLIDESSQVLQPEALKPLFCAKKFVLIGDSNQLPPVVKSFEAQKSGMSESLFERLESESSTIALRLQYRMNITITELANRLTYDGGLECASEDVASATLTVKAKNAKKWIEEALSTEMKMSAVFVDTCSYFETPRARDPCTSKVEVEIVSKLVSSLVESGLSEDSIGVMAPYRAQVQLLKAKCIHLGLLNVEVNTVDQYQGRDKEVILYSCTKENQAGRVTTDAELLSDKRRLTVAVTRAKHKLIVVGDKQTVVQYPPLEKLVRSLPDFAVISLREGSKDFLWTELFR